MPVCFGYVIRHVYPDWKEERVVIPTTKSHFPLGTSNFLFSSGIYITAMSAASCLPPIFVLNTSTSSWLWVPGKRGMMDQKLGCRSVKKKCVCSICSICGVRHLQCHMICITIRQPYCGLGQGYGKGNNTVGLFFVHGPQFWPTCSPYQCFPDTR